jgi:hypothetical protein
MEIVPVETIDLQKDLRYQEVPVKILDTVTRRTRNSEVRICRVQWICEDVLKKKYPHLFRTQSNLEDEIHFKWDRFVTSRKIHPKKSLAKNNFQNFFAVELKSFLNLLPSELLISQNTS